MGDLGIAFYLSGSGTNNLPALTAISLSMGQRWGVRMVGAGALALIYALSAPAQQPAQQPEQKPAPAALPEAPSASVTVTTAPPTAAEIHAEGHREVKEEEKQRILTVVPNFQTVISGVGVRLSPGQKTDLAFHATIDPFNAVSAFLLAGLSEAQGTYRGYGWGPGGYFKRVGANGGNLVSATMLSEAVYPILLHQDPRYFRQGVGPVRSRIKHALESAVRCRGDNGRAQFNYSNVLGNLSGGALSNLYYPPGSRGVGLTLENGAIVLGEGSLGNIALEFSADVNAWWQRHTGRHSTPAPPNP